MFTKECYSVLSQMCATMRCRILFKGLLACESVVEVCVLQSILLCCSLFYCVAVCFIVLQSVAIFFFYIPPAVGGVRVCVFREKERERERERERDRERDRERERERERKCV